MTQPFKKYAAEFLGTAFLVLLGCGAATWTGLEGTASQVLVAFAFGLGLTGIIAAFDAHVNPAVTLGAFITGRLSAKDSLLYIASQVAGAVVGAGLLAFLLSGKSGGYDAAASGLGQNGWAGVSTQTAFLVELLASFFFVNVILNVTANNSAHAAVTIGLTLTALILVFISVTGLSVNPARSIGPALIVGGTALQQVWLFIAAPLAGGALAGLFYKHVK